MNWDDEHASRWLAGWRPRIGWPENGNCDGYAVS
ncbi:hypothetical protein EV643_1356 [Kribbella sp. VKM Ac-2527]|uniref:Uncharacterized protein n=1 Tax=Kribbella caucasensis TaxID=2512215 RepID=A0A4R6J5I9_9ACTN|nr:hypothetical protein EV643_1356 [Kribbella sp. VKM Ac-2527]